MIAVGWALGDAGRAVGKALLARVHHASPGGSRL